MSLLLDHIVVLVEPLEAAISQAQKAGFTITPGGVHTDGATHNALICFADGSYLELLAFRREAPNHVWWHNVAVGPGLIDFALLPPVSTGETIAQAHARGLALLGPTPGGRERPDGVRLAWEGGRANEPELPFLCGDVTPREWRVPAGDNRNHANRVGGISAIHVACAELVASAQRYEQLLGQPAEYLEAMARFALGPTSLQLYDARDTAAAVRLARRGPGLFAVQFDTGLLLDADGIWH